MLNISSNSSYIMLKFMLQHNSEFLSSKLPFQKRSLLFTDFDQAYLLNYSNTNHEIYTTFTLANFLQLCRRTLLLVWPFTA